LEWYADSKFAHAEFVRSFHAVEWVSADRSFGGAGNDAQFARAANHNAFPCENWVGIKGFRLRDISEVAIDQARLDDSYEDSMGSRE